MLRTDFANGRRTDCKQALNMLNITENKLNRKVDLGQYEAARKVFHKRHYGYINRFLLGFSIAVLIMLFLPWVPDRPGAQTAAADRSIAHPGAH